MQKFANAQFNFLRQGCPGQLFKIRPGTLLHDQTKASDQIQLRVRCIAQQKLQSSNDLKEVCCTTGQKR